MKTDGEALAEAETREPAEVAGPWHRDVRAPHAVQRRSWAISELMLQYDISRERAEQIVDEAIAREGA